MPRLAVIDFETTGFSAATDEILQVAIIDETGAVLMNEFCAPQRCTTWPDAQKVHGIAPQDVHGKPFFAHFAPAVAEILQNAEQVVAYNDAFEKEFLTANGINARALRWGADPMLRFASFFGNVRRKLTTVAEFFGYDYQAHDALGDTRATLHAFLEMESGSLLRPLVQKAVPGSVGIGLQLQQESDWLRLLKSVDLCPITAKQRKPLFYKGISAPQAMPCEVIGFEDRSAAGDWLVLSLQVGDKIVHICDDFLREMQAPTFGQDANVPAVRRAASAAPAPASDKPKAAKSGTYQRFSAKKADLKALVVNTQASAENPFYEKDVVFTGDLALSREDAAQAVAALGATVKSGVSKKTNYVVIGAQDKTLVGESGRSSKEEKALALNASGACEITLLQEDEFLALLEKAKSM